jgi:glycosyltransferase involved in cell wall biosynthesis
MKYISFVVPSYNSEKYLNKCIDSLLVCKEHVEIIIVNDGSKDNTINIANEYKEKYPETIIVIDKENGGHGSGLNAGLEVASGIYYKCVDSDDWVDAESYIKLINTMILHEKNNQLPDMYFVNEVYERIDLNKSYEEKLENRIKPNEFITWKDVKLDGVADFLMMHEMIIKRDIILKSNTVLPHHTFYVDNIYAFKPLYHVKTMYYLNIPFYRYYVGRPNQSVTLNNMSKNYYMQIRVMKELCLSYTLDELKSLDKHHYKYMMHDLIVKSYLTFFFVYIKHDKQKIKEYKEYFKEFKSKNRKLYKKLRYRTYFFVVSLLIKPLKILAVKIGYKQIIKNNYWN